jgi:hypothetical protein
VTKKAMSPEVEAAKARVKEAEEAVKSVTAQVEKAQRSLDELSKGLGTWLKEKKEAELALEKLLPLKKRAADILKQAIAEVDKGRVYTFYYGRETLRSPAYKLEQLGYVQLHDDNGSMHLRVIPTEAGRKKAAEQ